MENSFQKYVFLLQWVDGSTYSYRHRIFLQTPIIYPMIYKRKAAALPNKFTKTIAARNSSIDHLVDNKADAWNCLTITRHMLMFHEWLPYPCGNYGGRQVYNWICEQKFTTVRKFYNNTIMRTISLGGTYCDGNWAYYESACIRLKQHISGPFRFISSGRCEYRQLDIHYMTIKLTKRHCVPHFIFQIQLRFPLRPQNKKTSKEIISIIYV